MAIISRKKTQMLKLIILSPLTEKILLTTHIVCVLVIGLYLPNLSQPSDYFLTTQIYKQNAADEFMSLTNMSQLQNFMNSTLISQVFTNSTTANMPITPIFIEFSRFSAFYDCPSNASYLSETCQSNTDNILDYLQNSRYGCTDHTMCQYYGWNRTGTITGYLGGYMKSDSIFLSKTNEDNTLVLEYFYDTGLFSQSVAAIQIQGYYYNTWTESIVRYQYVAEFSGSSTITKASFLTDIYDPNNITNQIHFVFAMIFMVEIIAMTIRVLLESTVQLNRIIFFFYLPFFCVVYGWLFLFLLISSRANDASFDYQEKYAVIDDLESAIYYFQTYKFFTGLQFIFLPFRLLTLLSWSKSSRILTLFFVMIFRVLPTFALYAGLAFFIGIFVLLSFWLPYQWDLPELAEFGSTITRFPLLTSSDVVKAGTVSRTIEFDVSLIMNWVIRNFTGLLFLGMLLAMTVDLIQRAALIDLDDWSPSEKEQRNKQMELEHKFERFLKELGLQFEKTRGKSDTQSIGDNRILVWIDPREGELADENDVLEPLYGKENFKIMVFNSPSEVVEFLRYLFKLKPNLQSSKAQNRFRIVAENLINFSHTEPSQEMKEFESLTQWLWSSGSKVPVMLFSKVHVDKDYLVFLRKRYPYLYYAIENQTVLRFCLMEDGIEKFEFIPEAVQKESSSSDDSSSDGSSNSSISDRTQDLES